MFLNKHNHTYYLYVFLNIEILTLKKLMLIFSRPVLNRTSKFELNLPYLLCPNLPVKVSNKIKNVLYVRKSIFDHYFNAALTPGRQALISDPEMATFRKIAKNTLLH